MSVFLGAVNTLARVIQNDKLIASASKQVGIIIQNRERHTKHWNPKFKKLRKEKVVKVKLPDFNEEKVEDEDPSSVNTEKMKAKLKEMGLKPAKPWIEKPVFISCTGSTFEEYVPPEGDGKYSLMTTIGAKQRAEFLSKKGKSYMAVRKIKSYEEGFSPLEFEEQAQEIYVKAHKAIAAKDDDLIQQYFTERAYPEVIHNIKLNTIRWNFMETLELPRIVQARCTHVITKENIFAQVTIRFHNQQTLAVYDRFGRLAHGSEIIKKDVLEYVVFERHLPNKYSDWRIHAKIIPAWMPPRESGIRTFIEPPQEPEELPPTQVQTATAEKELSQ